METGQIWREELYVLKYINNIKPNMGIKRQCLII